MTITGRSTAATPVGAPVRPMCRWLVIPAGVGLLVIVAGTFLPWLRSGDAVRNSYTADGVLRELLGLDGLTGAVLAGWPFLALLCAVALGLLILRMTRAGAGVALLCALAAGAVCIRVLTADSNVFVGAAPLGPSVTLAGSAVVVLAVLTAVCRAALAGASETHPARRIR